MFCAPWYTFLDDIVGSEGENGAGKQIQTYQQGCFEQAEAGLNTDNHYSADE